VRQQTTIEDACSFVTDGTHYTPKNAGNGVPFLTVKDVSDLGLDFVNCAFITGDDYQAAKNWHAAPQKGDVLFSKDGTVGKVHVVATDQPFAVLSSLAILRPRPERADARYLGHVLRSSAVLEDAVKRKTGSVIRRIILSDLKKVRIPLPPLSEQRRTAEVLDRAEALRAKRRAALAQLGTLNQSIFVEMFDDAATPSGWPNTELGSLCEEVIDCLHSTPIYADARTEYPCVRSSDIQSGVLDFSDTKYVEESEYVKRVVRGKPQVGDVIYCREGARFGNAARITTGLSLCLGQRMMLFRPLRGEVVSEYLWAYLQSPVAYRQASGTVAGSASPHVNVREIVAFRLPHPPIELQREFSRRVAAVEQLKSTHRAALAGLDALFYSLQQRAFRAEL
jgi:type I restriction enzyme S subunit